MDCYNIDFDILFETSWEVCNKVGGIYTVLSTKAKTLQNCYKDKTIFIGPDVWTEENPSPFFTESKTVLKKWREQATLPPGVTVRTGRWNIPGKPIAVLVKFDAMYAHKNDLYSRMWQLYGVDSLHAYGDYDEACAFSAAAAHVIESIARFYGVDTGKRMIAHFDEWTTGMALLHVKTTLPQIATVFTTHATSIGRSICGNGKPLYDYLKAYNGDRMAEELNMQSKHSLEKAAAWNADCFTTVSEVTAREAEQLLGRRPLVTPNGFEPDFVPAKTRYTAARKQARATLLDVAHALTGVDYPDDTFIVATSGRCEYRNKGLDVFLDAMNSLAAKSPVRKILAYVMVPAWCAGPRADLQHALSIGSFGRLSDPVITHGLHNYSDDPVNRRIHEIGFVNDADSQVSVIYVPSYLNGTDGIFNKSYYGLLPGLDATVFASYYEPWGYTPHESVAFGVPTVTTALAGFGQWVKDNFTDSFKASGVRVEERTDSNYTEIVAAIADDIFDLAAVKPRAMTAIRQAARDTAARATWADFIHDYDRAYCEALSARDARLAL